MLQVNEIVILKGTPWTVCKNPKKESYYLSTRLMTNLAVTMLFQPHEPYPFIQSIVGYAPQNGMFPEVKSLIDLQLVINRLKGEDSDFLFGLQLLAKRLPLAKAFLMYLRHDGVVTDSVKPRLKKLLENVVESEEECEWLSRATDVPIILSKKKYIQWLKINPQTKIEKWSRVFLESSQITITPEDREDFLSEVHEPSHISLIAYSWYKDTFKTVDLKEEERAIITRRKELDLSTECCVCYSDTGFILPCSHSLCLRCKKNIQNNLCPLCRVSYEPVSSQPLVASPPSHVYPSQGYIALAEHLIGMGILD